MGVEDHYYVPRNIKEVRDGDHICFPLTCFYVGAQSFRVTAGRIEEVTLHGFMLSTGTSQELRYVEYDEVPVRSTAIHARHSSHFHQHVAGK